jgi:hypothetical protein
MAHHYDNLAPDFAAAWNNHGIILQEMLKLDERRLCLERALAFEPAETLNNLGNTLNRAALFMEFGKAAEARASFEAAATCPGTKPSSGSTRPSARFAWQARTRCASRSIAPRPGDDASTWLSFSRCSQRWASKTLEAPTMSR